MGGTSTHGHPDRRLEGRMSMRIRWCKSKCEGTECDGGSYGTYQKRVYALQVAMNLDPNGEARCHCGAEINLWNGEVDRTTEGCYRPGFVVMTCHDCNNDRTHIPQFDSEAFKRDVLNASQGIVIVGQTEAKALWLRGRDIGTTVRRSRYYQR